MFSGYANAEIGGGLKNEQEWKYIFRIDGRCSVMPKLVGEWPRDYALRVFQPGSYTYKNLDPDCLIENYTDEELKKFRSQGDIVSRYISALNEMNYSVNLYCRGEILLHGGDPEINDFKGLYYDYSPEYYLLIARINQKFCRKFEYAYKYFVAAELSGGRVSHIEKSEFGN